MPLARATVLIGENNSGKSSVLDCISLTLGRRWGQRGTGFSEYDLTIDGDAAPDAGGQPDDSGGGKAPDADADTTAEAAGTGDSAVDAEVLAAVYIRALMANKGVAGTTRCRAGRQDAASRQASSRLLRCAPALRVTRPNVLTHRVFMAGSELPATSRPICENTSSPEVNPHILCSPFIRGFSQPPTRSPGSVGRAVLHRADGW